MANALSWLYYVSFGRDAPGYGPPRAANPGYWYACDSYDCALALAGLPLD